MAQRVLAQDFEKLRLNSYAYGSAEANRCENVVSPHLSNNTNNIGIWPMRKERLQGLLVDLKSTTLLRHRYIPL